VKCANWKAALPQLSTVFTREVSQIIPHVYTRFEPAAVRVDEKNIDLILTVKDAQLPDIEPELNLFDDAYRLNRHAPVINEMLEELRLRARAGDPCDGKTLTDFFERCLTDGTQYWYVSSLRLVQGWCGRLKYEGKPYHDFKVTRAQELLTKALNFRKTDFLYDPQESLTPEERREVQKAIDRLFHRMEPDTVNIMASALEEELEKLEDQNIAQSILVQERSLPVKPILKEGQGLIKDVREHPQLDRRLKAFLLNAEKVKTLKDYQIRLQEFIEAGRPTDYRRAQALKRAVERALNVIPKLNEPQVRDWLNEMQAIEEHQEIISKWATYYQNLQPLLQRYQAAYEEQHKARQTSYAQVQAELSALEYLLKAWGSVM